MRFRAAVLAAAIVLIGFGCGDPAGNSGEAKIDSTAADAEVRRVEEIRTAMKAIEPFFRPMVKPGRFDWLATYKEPGETFDQYMDADPSIPTAEKQTIFVVPLGKFNDEQKRVIAIASEFLSVFYDLPVKTLPARSIPENLSERDVRRPRKKQLRQIRTGYILDNVLPEIMPDDAAALIAFTDEDLFPDSSMNYVFGQASLDSRVGVWSLARLDDNADRQTFTERTIKIAAHETGHMFSMRHCTKYECLMSGTNHLGETDRRPLDACPECMAKICWFSRVALKERYEKLADLCRRFGLNGEAATFAKKAAAVSR